MDRKWLEDYEQAENNAYSSFLTNVREGKFSFENDKYPTERRFNNLQKPVAKTILLPRDIANIWAEVPFSGSLIVKLPPYSVAEFENTFCKVSKIPELVDFIKETGRLQIMINARPTMYEGLDFLDPIFSELNPPVSEVLPAFIFGEEAAIQKAIDNFFTLAELGYFSLLGKLAEGFGSRFYRIMLEKNIGAYVVLKLQYRMLAEQFENLMVDNPAGAFRFVTTCANFITDPLRSVFGDITNHTSYALRRAQELPTVYQPNNIRFPYEIGKFLMRKLTYAPIGLDACKELIYNYDAYDLRKVEESLNEGIVTNHPDVVNKSVEDFSEILDNVWNDKTIPRRIKSLQVGIPVSMAAIGSIAAGPIGATGGFLAGLGLEVANELLGLETEGLSERLAKLKTRSYQVNIYDFKKKHKESIVQPSKNRKKKQRRLT